MRFVGKLLSKVRAGHTKLAYVWVPEDRQSIKLTSPAFEDGAPMAQKYAGKGVGDNISPPLQWTNVPAGTVEFVLVVEDADAPLPSPIVHCLVTAIDPSRTSIEEGELNKEQQDEMTIGNASMKRRGYQGPRPIPGHGTHHYAFQLFAVDTPLQLEADAALKEVRAAMKGHILAVGVLVGTYET